jgi:hypothetical protein
MECDILKPENVYERKCIVVQNFSPQPLMNLTSARNCLTPFLGWLKAYGALVLPRYLLVERTEKTSGHRFHKMEAPSRPKHYSHLSTIRSWVAKFPDANVGIVTGSLSWVSVIDVDSADLMVQRRMIERFGDTPLKTRTPSGAE